MNKDLNYEEDLKISVNDLDLDCKEQPELMMKYSEYVAKMEKERDQAKAVLEYIEAELDKDVRNNPEKYDLEKLNESKVAAAIKRQKKYKDAEEVYINAKFEAQVAKGTVTAFNDRKTQLSNLVELYKGQYFAGPSVPRDLQKKWQERQQIQQKKTNKEVGTKLKQPKQ